MPTISRQIALATDDALSGLKFKVQGSPALVTLAASTETATEALSFSVGSQEFCSGAVMNVRTDDSCSVDRDVILLQEAVPAGEYYLAFAACAGTINYLLIIEPVPV